MPEERRNSRQSLRVTAAGGAHDRQQIGRPIRFGRDRAMVAGNFPIDRLWELAGFKQIRSGAAILTAAPSASETGLRHRCAVAE